MNKNNQNKRIDEHELHEELHKLFSVAKEISLSHEEKRQGAVEFHNFMKENPDGQKSILSPYIKNIFISTFKLVKQRQLVAVALALVIILGGAGGTVYAAGNSLPGDLLYPIKIHVNEKLESAFARGTEAETRVAVKHTITRIEEVERLAIKGRVDKTDEESVSVTLASQSKAVRDNILKLKTEGNVDAAISISSDFENSLNDHKKNLENIVRNSGNPGRGFLTRTRENIRDNILASAKERLILEDNLSTSSQLIINKKIANDELSSSQKKIRTIEGSVNASNNIDEETQDTLKNAVRTVAEGEEKINVGAYSNAVVLLKDAKEHTAKLEEKLKKSYSYSTGSSKTKVTTSTTATVTARVNATSSASSTSEETSTGSSTLNIQNNNLPVQASPTVSPNPAPAPSSPTPNLPVSIPSIPNGAGGLLH